MKYITIALAKGRLAKQTLALLEQTGITCEEMKDKNTRKLIFINEELKLKFFLSKTSDVPTYVEYGAADLGVVGSDTIMEEGRKVLEVLDLGLGKCNMCVAGPSDILISSAGVNPTLEGIPAFAADDFAGKSIALLVFVITFLNPFFQSPLVDECICCLKILMTDNRFMVVSHHVLVHFPVIFMPIEIIIGISFLKNYITCVFLIC